MDYTPEQQADILDRTKQGVEALKKLNLIPSAIISKVNIAEGVFADHVQPFLEDTKYTTKTEQKNEPKEDGSNN